MQRVLKFDGEKGQQRFAMCRVAILSAGDGKGERNRETLRKEARLLDAFDAISDPAKAEGDPDARTLKPETVSISVSQEDHALLLKYLDATPWLPRASRDAVDVQDWADSAEKVD